MGAYSSEDVKILAIGTVLIGLQAAVCLRHACRRSSLDAVRRRMRRVCRWMGPARETRETRETSSESLDKLVDHTFRVKRVAAARKIHTISSMITSTAVAAILINVAAGESRWMTLWQTAMCHLMLAVYLFIGATPALTPRLIDVYYGLSMLSIAFWVRFASPEHFVMSAGSALGLRVMCSLGNISVRNTIAWNVVAVCVSYSHVLYVDYGDVVTAFLRLELAATLFILYSLATFKEWVLAGVRQELQVGLLKSEISSTMSLISMVCDVVVELNTNFAVVADSHPMAAFLLRSSSAPLAGTSFCDFMPDEAEQIRFRETLAALRTGADASVGTCRIALSDSLCNHFNVEVFFVKVSKLDEGLRYIVGIREFMDEIAAMPGFRQAREKRRREPRLHGTPHSVEHADLQAKDLPEVPGSQTPRSIPEASAALRFPELLQTREDVKCKELVACMSAWNINVPRMQCCTLHAYVMEAKAIVRDKLSMLPCADFPSSPFPGAQCERCGLIFPAEETQCAYCAQDLTVIPSRAEEVPPHRALEVPAIDRPA